MKITGTSSTAVSPARWLIIQLIRSYFAQSLAGEVVVSFRILLSSNGAAVDYAIRFELRDYAY